MGIESKSETRNFADCVKNTICEWRGPIVQVVLRPFWFDVKVPAVLSTSSSFSLFQALWGSKFKILGNFEDSSSQHSNFSVASCMFYFDARVSVFLRMFRFDSEVSQRSQTWKTTLHKAPEQTIRNKTTKSRTQNKIERRSPTDKGRTSRTHPPPNHHEQTH